jgi:protein-tyrosine phosphatase
VLKKVDALFIGKITINYSAAGISRSSTFVIAYLMKTNKWKFDEAFNYVKGKRSVICPNGGFIDRLLDFEVQLGLSTLEEIELKRKKCKSLASAFD